jgi:hypothetical protein
MRAGGVAIVIGAAVGVLVALLRQSESPPSAGVATTPERPRQSAPRTPGPGTSVSNASNASSPAPSAAEAAPSAAPSTEPAPPASVPAPSAPEASAAPLPSAAPSVGPATPFPLATPLPPVTTASELERAEIRCYQVDPEECGRAADAYDAGQLVARDAARAARLRKVELTRLVRRCEERSPHACLVLAGRYEAGQGVDENDRHARALVEHARELCQHGAKTGCNGGEPQ